LRTQIGWGTSSRLDKCSLLDSVRAEPRFAAVRERVVERCPSIYDAMWS